MTHTGDGPIFEDTLEITSSTKLSHKYRYMSNLESLYHTDSTVIILTVDFLLGSFQD